MRSITRLRVIWTEK